MVEQFDVSQMTADQRDDLRRQLNDNSRPWWHRLVPAGAQKAARKVWDLLGNPFIGLALIALLVFYGMSDDVADSVWGGAKHYLGVLLVIAVGGYFLVLFCYFLLDPFLSFKEFNKLVGRWWRGEPVSETDVKMGQAMAVRSGLVFLGLCILANGGMHYWDFGAKVAEKAAGG